MGGLPLLLDDGDHAYLYGPSLTPVAQVDGSGTVQYLHGDLLGSVRTITDASGAVVGASTFDAFGSRTAHTGTGGSLFGFTGNWTDPDTQLVHLRARDYDPATGQFLTVDPAVDSTGQPYAYTGNSPLLRTDPSGLDFWSDARDLVGSAAQAVRDNAGCILEQAAAFTAGALDSLTFGASSVVLGAVVPGYDDFVAGHEAAFTAGSIAATVIQAVVIVITTAGAGAGLAVGLVVLKSVAKSAIKSGVKAVERTAVRTVERASVEIGRDSASLFKPGSFAGNSIPARGPQQTFLASERRSVNEIGHQSGCHSCGTTTPGTTSRNFVPDHQPVSRFVRAETPQRLYPQCLPCSNRQGLDVINALRRGENPYD